MGGTEWNDFKPARAAASIATLVLAVAAACLGLMPAQPVALLGLEVLVGAIVVWPIEARASVLIVWEDEPAGFRLLKVAIGLLPLALIPVGALMLLGGNADGSYAVAIGSILAVGGAVLFAWVALIEILRWVARLEGSRA